MRVPTVLLSEKGLRLSAEIARLVRCGGDTTRQDLYEIADLAHAIHVEASKSAERIEQITHYDIEGVPA